MSLCTSCDDTREEYVGNGGQNDFTWSFQYNQINDVKVAFWDNTRGEYIEKTSGWFYLNATTIRFDDPAPAVGQKFIIYRCTNLNPLPATFYPGASIKAQDLNANFEALKFAVEESACNEGGGGSGDEVYLTLNSLTSNSPITIEYDTVNNIAKFRINLQTLDPR